MGEEEKPNPHTQLTKEQGRAKVVLLDKGRVWVENFSTSTTSNMKNSAIGDNPLNFHDWVASIKDEVPAHSVID